MSFESLRMAFQILDQDNLGIYDLADLSIENGEITEKVQILVPLLLQKKETTDLKRKRDFVSVEKQPNKRTECEIKDFGSLTPEQEQTLINLIRIQIETEKLEKRMKISQK